jgi:selenocysteine lyase/cysteine desulfurase
MLPARVPVSSASCHGTRADIHSFDATTLVEKLISACGAAIAARNGVLRVSPHFYNTEDDITRFPHGLEQVLRGDAPR